MAQQLKARVAKDFPAPMSRGSGQPEIPPVSMCICSHMCILTKASILLKIFTMCKMEEA